MSTYTKYIARFTKLLTNGDIERHTLNFKTWERRAFAIAHWRMKGYTAAIL